MKILATFDGTPFSEAILEPLAKMAALPGAEITLLMIDHQPGGKLRPTGRRLPEHPGWLSERGTAVTLNTEDPTFFEDKGQAIVRRTDEIEEYLTHLAHRLPKGAATHVEGSVSGKPADVIIERAREEGVDVVVMATHSATGVRRALFGSTTDAVVRSGVAPVLVVHPGSS